jgi:hypothetical protein
VTDGHTVTLRIPPSTSCHSLTISSPIFHALIICLATGGSIPTSSTSTSTSQYNNNYALKLKKDLMGRLHHWGRGSTKEVLGDNILP